MDWKTLLFSFKGRINRAKFWLGALIIFLSCFGLLLAALAVTGLVNAVAGSGAGTFVYAIAIIAMLVAAAWAQLAISIKRLHDRGKGGLWLLLFFLVPITLSTVADVNDALLILALPALALYVWAIVELGCLKGTDGPNAYGPDPLASTVLPDDGRTEPA